MREIFTFIDLFSGIGGFRIALEKLGGRCLGFSEINKKSISVYNEYFNKDSLDEYDLGDITTLSHLPKADVLVGGVPCQSWSVAGKMRGFEDPRGRLWYDSIRMIEINKPKVFIFENVKGLFDPRNRENLNLIVNNLINAGYNVHFSLLNSYDFGLPQNRERIFIVGFRKDLKFDTEFTFPPPLSTETYLGNFMDNIVVNKSVKQIFNSKDLFGKIAPPSRNKFQKNNELNDFFVFCDTRNGHTTIHSWDIIDTTEKEKNICMTILRNRRKKIYGSNDGNPLSFNVLKSLIGDIQEEELKVLVNKKILRFVVDRGYEFVNSKNSSGINGIYRIYLPHSRIFSTLTATGTKDMIALHEVSGKTPEEYKQNFIDGIYKKSQFREITPREAARLQGFPEDFPLHPIPKIALFQFGNAVSVPVVYNLMKSVIETGIFNIATNKQNGRTKEKRDSSKSKGMDEELGSYQSL